MKKDRNTYTDRSLLSKIPYICGYEEDGMIESVQGQFSRMYAIEEMKTENISSFDTQAANRKVEELLNSLPENVDFQFIVHNKLIEQQSYLENVLIKPDIRGKVLEPLIEKYNRVITDNIDIGHNNVKKDLYFVVSVNADIADDARRIFDRIDGEIRLGFSKVYGIQVYPMDLIDRLHVMYAMFNPGKDDFGMIAGVQDVDTMTVQRLKSRKISTKDIVAPKTWDTRTFNLNYTILNEGSDREQYTRAFFINSLPETISPSMISDLTNISSSMVFSIIYEPVDAETGFDISAKLVSDNTVVTQKSKRDTVAERKRHETVSIETARVNSEKEYFNKEALGVFKEARAREDKVKNCTFTVLLYANDLETLDRDSELLRISATKFASSVKCLDLLQLQGFQTCLPLCSSKVDVSRIMDMERLAMLSPVNIQDIARKNGVFVGLNAINDNLILINRKNNANLNGFIAGTEHSGKTYQNKREIFNAMISSDDKVNVITYSDEYDSFAKTLGGKTVTSAWMDPFEMVEDYGLIQDGSIFKAYFLEGFVSSLLGTPSGLSEEESDARAISIEKEVNSIVKRMKEGQFSGSEGIISYIKANVGEYPHIADSLFRMKENYDMEKKREERDGRLTVYKVSSAPEILLTLDYLWNRSIEDKKGNISNWIFIDPVDDVLKDPAASAYLSEFMVKADMFKEVLTAVVQDAVQLFNNPVTALGLEDVVANSGYAKLLNTGPIERKKFVDLLNIPNALLPYISNVEPGKGIIITSASNIAFDDSFLEEDDPFRRLFAKDIRHIRFM